MQWGRWWLVLVGMVLVVAGTARANPPHSPSPSISIATIPNDVRGLPQCLAARLRRQSTPTNTMSPPVDAEDRSA